MIPLGMSIPASPPPKRRGRRVEARFNLGRCLIGGHIGRIGDDDINAAIQIGESARVRGVAAKELDTRRNERLNIALCQGEGFLSEFDRPYLRFWEFRGAGDRNRPRSGAQINDSNRALLGDHLSCGLNADPCDDFGFWAADEDLFGAVEGQAPKIHAPGNALKGNSARPQLNGVVEALGKLRLDGFFDPPDRIGFRHPFEEFTSVLRGVCGFESFEAIARPGQERADTAWIGGALHLLAAWARRSASSASRRESITGLSSPSRTRSRLCALYPVRCSAIRFSGKL